MTVAQLIAYLSTLSDQQAQVMARIEISTGSLSAPVVGGRTGGHRVILEAK